MSAAAATPRERLLAAADELFYAEGVQTVGIDRIIARAGVAKASLYSQFGSKEALVRAYLDARHAATTARLREFVDRHDDPGDRLLAPFDAQAELFATPGFRGCAFTSACAEAPPDGLVTEAAAAFRADLRDLFTELASDAGVPDPDATAAELHLLYDGAGLAARMDGDAGAAATAREAAARLVDVQRETTT
jgi:AcrR family transcriptional regulator